MSGIYSDYGRTKLCIDISKVDHFGSINRPFLGIFGRPRYFIYLKSGEKKKAIIKKPCSRKEEKKLLEDSHRWFSANLQRHLSSNED